MGHRQEAEKLLDIGTKSSLAHIPQTEIQTLSTLMRAQTHATLALVDAITNSDSTELKKRIQEVLNMEP